MEDSTIVNSENNSWLQDAIKKGLVLGTIHVLVFLLIYLFVPSKITGFSYVAFIFVFNAVYLIYFGREWRQETGGFLSYGAAFKYLFVLLLANGILSIIFSVVMLLADPVYPEVMAESQFNTSIYWAEKMGAPGNAIDKMREDFNEEEAAKGFSWKGISISVVALPIIYSIVASIFALFIRKEKPETF
jgi:hypothetical protein